MNYPAHITNTNSSEDKTRFSAISKSLSKRGYRQEEINQAVAATALAGDRAAAAWLCNHSGDTNLGGAMPRVFYLHLCPVGGVEASFQEFWSRYRAARGWCASMDYETHATIVEPFEVSPGAYLDLLRAYNTAARLFANRRLVKRLRLLPSDFNDNHLGFVIDPDQALLELAREFAAACQRVNIRVSVRHPPHRLSLCCGFQQAQYLQIQKEISEHFRLDPVTKAVLPDPSDASVGSAGLWQLRLYSRDVRLNNGLSNELHSVYRMACERPMSDDDGAASAGDMHYSVSDRVALLNRVSPPKHGWGLGFNVETGVMGNFPLLFAQRIPCYEAWTLHRLTPMQCAPAAVGFSEISPDPADNPSARWLVPVATNPAACSSPTAVAMATPSLTSSSSSSSSSAATASGNEATPKQSNALALMSNGDSRTAATAAAATVTASAAPAACNNGNGTGSGSGESFEMAPLSPASGISSSSGFRFSPLIQSGPAFVFDHHLHRMSLGSTSDAASLSSSVGGGGGGGCGGQHRPRRQLHVLRHAEPLDDALLPDWSAKALDINGRLVNRFDLSIPPLLPVRTPVEFVADPPLTLISQFVCSQIGVSLGRCGVRYSLCYCSPTLACVQSAHFTLAGVGQSDLLIRLEPMLLDSPDNSSAAASGGPVLPRVFLSSNKLREFGYNVDDAYSPLANTDCLDQLLAESYKDRLAKVLKKAIDSCKTPGGRILIVGHRATVEHSLAALATHRGSGGGAGRSGSGGSSSVSSGGSGGGSGCAATIAMTALCRRPPSVPYAALHCLEERSGGRRGWASCASPTATCFSLRSHSPFDAATLLP